MCNPLRSLVPALALLAAAVTGQADADVTLEMIGNCQATDVSADGSAIAGISDAFGTFRWTEADGIVDLGRNAWLALGRGAGSPDISADGTRVSASIVDITGTLVTSGLWELGVGWTDLMPPQPPDGGIIDEALGSAWGMSGDGQVVTGLYWRPGNFETGGAHASTWTQETGTVDLGSGGGNSRANGANSDGSIIVGWDENPITGPWRPAVWENGVKTILGETFDSDSASLAEAVTSDGSIIVGSSWNATFRWAEATMWTRDSAAQGAGWVEVPLGVLPGTIVDLGVVQATGISDDGSIIVGFNQFVFGNYTGFIWTEATGMVHALTFLADNGITLEPNFILQSFSGISGDGTTIIGFGQETVFPFATRSFVIRLVADCPWDCDGADDGIVGINDFLALLGQWDTAGSCDFDGAGVGINDFLELLANWGECP